MKSKSTKIMAMLLAVVMVVSLFPMSVTASFEYDETATGSYYKLISQKFWKLAPGIEETEVVINNAASTRRQVVHSVKVDLNNPYTNVLPGYKGMIPEPGNYGTQTVSQQALGAERLGYGNVVAATNATLSWYTEAYYKNHPELIGEPLAYAILNGYYYENSNGKTYGMSKTGSDGILVINYDKHPVTGEPRPDSIPKVLMRTLNDPLTGWEQNAIPAWQWLVKPNANGVPTPTYNINDHGTSIASRTFVGITADGEVIIAVSDGDQAPFSTGFTMGEMADYMIRMGCIYACNQDGGGSTTFCTQRPGEDLKVNCSLSDGGERPVTSTIMVVSTAPADGELSNATISSDYDYYTPGSTVAFNTIGIDASGAIVEIPAEAQWQIAEEGMGTIANGVFTSNGTMGTVTAQLVYKGSVVGERKITIAVPEAISMNQPTVTIPYGKTASIPIKATVNSGLNEIGLGPNDISFTTDNPALGTFNGLSFTAVDQENAPENITSNVTATLNMGSNPTLNFQLQLGRGSDVLFDFEAGQSDVDIWNVIDNRKGTIWDYDMALSLADKENGQVHDGEYSMRLELNGLSSNLSHSAEYGWIRLGIDGDAIELENARSLGFWMYIPDECIQLWAQGNYMADTDGNGTYDTQCLVSMPPAFPNQVLEKVDEPGWYYLEMDLSQYQNIALKDSMQFVKDPSTGASGAKGDFFISFIFARAKNNPILDGKTVIGPYTFYLDNFTVDYSEAVDDREKPEFDKIYMDGTPLVKHEVGTTTSNTLTFTSNVADATEKIDANKVSHPLTNTSGINAASAKAFIDGVEVPTSYVGGVMTAANVSVADGYHRVRFEITDNAGNTAVMIRVFKVEAGSAAPALQLVPADASLDRILFGSVYWMNLEATAIENIQSVETVIDLNMVNHWELDHMELAKGFAAAYEIDDETNTAVITFTRTGSGDVTGSAVLARIPVRVLDYDNDIHVSGKTAAQYWASHEFWGHNLALDVDKGLVTFTDGSTQTFSNEEFSVSTEMYTARYYMDATYLTSHGSTHIHSAAALPDKEATCTEDGYTGRTFCEGCNSVVEWGTTIPATGHSFHVVGDKLACDCGETITGSGLHMIDGKNYYTIGGVLAKGWNNVDDGWYYFDEDYAGINGKRTFDGIEYNFTDGLVEGVWKYDGVGTRYYYGPGYYEHPRRSQLGNFIWVTIDGNTYAFDDDGHRFEGYAVLTTADGTSKLYEFTDEGVLIGEYSPGEDYTGIFVCRRTTTYLKNGVPFAAGLVKEGEDYYYINSGCEAVTGNYDVTRTNGLLLPGFYQFGPDGKMINPPVYPDGPNRDGFFYRNGAKLPCYQLVEFDGYYYFISDSNRYAKDTRLYLSSRFLEGTGLSVGYYDFDKLGRMVLRDGPNEDGYFYLKDIQQEPNQLIAFRGYYYFIGEDGKYVFSQTLYLGEEYLEGTGLPAGEYEFDETGKMIIPEENVKNGPDADGYFYLNNIRQAANQLIELEGSYYYIREDGKYAVSESLYLSEEILAGTGLPAGEYEFDETGKMIIPEPPVKNGPNEDGYFYLDDVRQEPNQLIEFEGSYYYIREDGKYAVSESLYLSEEVLEGTGLPAGEYEFDETGKMIIPEIPVKNGPDEDGYFYLNNVRQPAKQLIAFEGDYYYTGEDGKYVVSANVYLGLEFMEPIGLPGGYYDFDEAGKLIPVEPAVKNGPNADGYFYLNDVKQKAYQLIWFEGGYYFINDSNKFAASRTIYLSTRFVEGTGLAVGYYEFDQYGKMIMKNGPYPDGYFYRDGSRLNAYQLVEYEGDYYFINDANKYAVSRTIYLSARFVEGTDLAVGYYEFDETGKMIRKNGPYPDGYFYRNGSRLNAYQLVEYEGDYYFINDANKYAVSRTIYLSARFLEGTDLAVGYYEFDETGKMIRKNGPYPDGYFYRNGSRLNAYQLVEYEGDYYFINDSNKYAVSKTIYLTAKFVDPFGMAVGYYEFDASGKMIMKNGPYPDGYFYLNGTRVNAYQLVKYEGDYYFIGVGNKYVTNKWQYVAIPDYVFDGTDVRPWHHSFDNQGRMIGYYEGVPNGRDLGKIYNLKAGGKQIKSGLLIRGCELDNANYYFPTDIIDTGIDRLQDEFHVKFDMDLRSETMTGLDVFGDDVTHKCYDMVMYEQIFTDEGKAKVKEVFTDLANPDNYPIYMHCTHGIDRTGTVSFLLEAVLGVERQMLIYEYTLSVGSYGNKIVAVYNQLNSSYSGSSFKVKTENFLKDCGITQEQIDMLRQIYLED